MLIQVPISDIGCRCVLSRGELMVFCVSYSEHKLLHSDRYVLNLGELVVFCVSYFEHKLLHSDRCRTI